MKLRLDRRARLAAATACASLAPTLASFAVAGRADGVLATAACALLWLAVVAWALPAATACLAISLGLAALSALAGGPGWLAVTAAAASVAAWDLAQLSAGGAPAADAAGERRLLRARGVALAAGLLPGVVLAALLGPLRLSLPFPAMLALAAGALVALYRAARA